jgi:tRNA(fMet)-specific endonuclease VapC
MEISLVLDTSAYSNFIIDKHELQRFINARNPIYIPVIVLGELKSGFINGNRTKENNDFLAEFLDASNVTILEITEKSAQIYAEISFQLRKAGTPIGTNDMWIAAICIENKLPLLTLDADFSKISGLSLVEV